MRPLRSREAVSIPATAARLALFLAASFLLADAEACLMASIHPCVLSSLMTQAPIWPDRRPRGARRPP